jgi:hypothetical protein
MMGRSIMGICERYSLRLHEMAATIKMLECAR